MNRLLPTLAFLPVAPLSATLAPAAMAQAVVASEMREVSIPASPTSREDSIRLHRSARSRQAAFERLRRHNLPWAWGGGRGECDERIGRFCLTYSEEDAPEWVPPEEPTVVANARWRLLDQLTDAATAIPGDGWVVAQLVRYLAEVGRFDAARTAADLCRGERWWCEAVRGFAAHQAGDSGAADAAFARMLRAMPEEKREEWTDLSQILDRRPLRVYRRLNDEEKQEFETRFWILADPLLQTPGNELRSEHFSRNLLVELQDDSETTENLSWSKDLREILLRFGAPSGWERIRRPFQLHSAELSLLTHYPDADIDLVPPPELLVGEFDPLAGVWNDEDRRARASYPLPQGRERLRWIDPLEYQVAVFRDRDSARVVVAYSLPEDSFPGGATVDAVLSARLSVHGEPLVTRDPSAGREAVLTLSTPQRPALVSIETLSRERRRAARARFGLGIPPLLPGLLSASDLLILSAEADSVPESREEAIRRARGSLRVRAGERIGIYWEIYSPAVEWPERLEISLRLLDADAGWLRRLAERAGVVDRIEPIRIVWGESGYVGETLPRSLVLRIPEEVKPGQYDLEVSVLAPGREPVVVRRTLEVVG